jgi:arginase
MTRPILSARAVSCQRDALAPRRAHPRLPGPGWGRDDLAVVWLDAHGDFNTPAITISGYLGGMALAMLTGLAPGLCRDGLGLRPVADADIVLADARDLDPAERDALAASHVRRVHLDVDVIDSAELPGLRFPSGPGPSVTQIEECLAAVCSAADVKAACIVCAWLPDRVGDPATLEAITRLTRALGADLAWPPSVRRSCARRGRVLG